LPDFTGFFHGGIFKIFRSAETLLEFDRIKKAGAAYAVSGAGKDLFLSLKPGTSFFEIKVEFELLGQLMSLLDRGEDVPIYGLTDPRHLISKLDSYGAFLEAKELIELASFLDAIRKLERFIQRHKGSSPSLYNVFQGFFPISEISEKIRKIIDEDGSVSENASQALRKISSKLASYEKKVQKELQKIIKRLGPSNALQDNYYTLRGDRYVIPVRAGARAKVSGLVHDVSKSAETFFIEPLEVVEITNQLSTLRIEKDNEILKILIETSNEITLHLEDLKHNSILAGKFDFLYARARFAFINAFSIPEIVENRELRLLKAHHPLLYLKDKKTSVPITLKLDENDRVLVISGPNAGGKTTALKTLGLLSIMAQSGLAIPAFADTRIPIFNKWFADIGDAQDITEGVSTFSAHIRNIIHILKEVDDKSLVLLDELGTATDPMEGASLAVSLLEKLAEKASITIATSHLSPMKAWAHDFPSARNASFRLDETTHQPTFKIVIDVPGASEAFLIAEREGLPKEILDRAAQLLPKGEADLTGLVQSLQIKEKEIEESRKKVKHLIKEQKSLRFKVQELQDFLKEKKRRLTDDMMAEKEEVLKNAKAFVEKQLVHIPSRHTMEKARKELTKEIQSVQKKRKKSRDQTIEPVDPDKFMVGQTVFMRSMNEFCEIRKIDKVKMTAMVVIKGMEITTPLSGLRLPEKGEIPQVRYPKVTYERKKNISYDLDLHGMRVDDMLREVEQYLNDAVLADLPYVRIMHGVGTGALRRALHDHLRNHPLVKVYRYGTPEEGAGGVTIVKF
jgi:DNA mismatch repair protein MutS2